MGVRDGGPGGCLAILCIGTSGGVAQRRIQRADYRRHSMGVFDVVLGGCAAVLSVAKGGGAAPE